MASLSAKVWATLDGEEEEDDTEEWRRLPTFLTIFSFFFCGRVEE